MPKISNKAILFVLFTAAIIGAFYWWQIRPAQIRKECANEVVDALRADDEQNRNLLDWQRLYDMKFEACVNKRGLK